MSSPQSEGYLTLDSVPLSLVRFMASYLLQRLKIFPSVAVLVEDLAEIENAYGKGLTKLANQPFGAKGEWLPGYTLLWEKLLKTTTGQVGKLHSSLSVSLVQNVSKTFPEESRKCTKNVNSISTKLVNLAEDLRKAKQAHQRNYEKYVKLIQEAESAIRIRDAAIEAELKQQEREANQLGTPQQSQQQQQQQQQQQSQQQQQNQQSQSQQQADLQPKEDGFMKRAGNLLSKITPGDNQKRLNEKCRECIREIDLAELQLSSNARRLHASQNDLLEEMSQSLHKMDDIENQRIHISHEGLIKLVIAENVQMNRLAELQSSLASRNSAIDTDAEISTLLWTVDQPGNGSSAAGGGSMKDSVSSRFSGDSTTTGDGDDSFDLFPRVEKLVEVIESLKYLVSRAIALLIENADMCRSYGKGVQRVLEKHGYLRKSNPSSSIASQNLLLQNLSLTCAEIMGTLESPSLKLGWEVFVKLFSDFAESHSKRADFYMGVCTSLEALQRRLDVAKKDLQEKQTVNAKKIDMVNGTSSKLSQKLLKCQSTLKERREAIKKARDDVADAEGGGRERVDSGGGAGETGENNGGGTGPGVPEEGAKRRQTDIMMQGFEKLRSTKLSVAVGLETPSERISRIEGRIVTLEEEEKELIETLQSAKVNVGVIYETARKDILNALNSAKEVICNELGEMKRIIESVVECNMDSQDVCLQAVQRFKTKCDSVTIDSDKSFFFQNICAKGRMLPNEGDASLLMDFAPVEMFEAIRSSMIEEERKVQGISQLYLPHAAFAGNGTSSPPSSPTSPSSRNNSPGKSSHFSAPFSAGDPRRLSTDSDAGSPTNIDNGGPPQRRRSKSAGSLDEVVTASGISKPRDSEVDSTLSRLSAHSMGGSESDKSVIRLSEDAVSENQDKLADGNSTKSTSSFAGSGDDSAKLPSQASSNVNVNVQASSPPGTGNATLVVDAREVRVSSKDDKVVTTVATTVAAASTSSTSSSFTSTTATTTTATAATPTTTAPTSTSGKSILSPQTSGKGKQPLMSPVPASKEDVSELTKFGLSSNDRILESYTCALYPKKGFLIHGRMLVTQHYVAFSGWPETRVLLAMNQMSVIEKMNTLSIIPNAILIKTASKEEYFFASFIDRDPCYSLLVSMSEVAKRLTEIHGDSALQDKRDLVFGFQTAQKDTIMQALNTAMDFIADVDSGPSDSGTKSQRPMSQRNGAVSPEPDTSGVSSAKSIKSTRTASATGRDDVAESSQATVEVKGTMAKVFSPIPESNATTSASPLTTTATAAAQQILWEDMREDNVSLPNLFSKSGIVPLMDQLVNFSASTLWKACWLEGSGYGDFLDSEGDLDIGYDEWIPLGATPVPEDVSKLPFSHRRPFKYAHPRTTMLMFGPKNAPATQMQFLYAFGKKNASKSSGSGNVFDPKDVHVSRAVVLTMTQFDGIPMADCFKVLQYWCFEDIPKKSPNAADQCMLRVGVHVHFIKSTMLKAQVASGVKDELGVLAKKWCLFAQKRSAQFVASLRTLDGGEDSSNKTGADAQAAATASAVTNPNELDAAMLPASRRGSRRISSAGLAVPSTDEAHATTAMGSHSHASRTGSGGGGDDGRGGGGGGGIWGYKYFFVTVALMSAALYLQYRYNRSLMVQVETLHGKIEGMQRLLDSHSLSHNQLKAAIEGLKKDL